MTDFNPIYGTATPFVFDDLIAGDNLNVITKGDVTIVSGQNLTRGALLGQITTGGKYTLSLNASSDGSQVASAILANDVDASGGDVTNCLIYVAGEFNQNKVIFGTGQTAANTYASLRDQGIFLKTAVPG